ncbi:class I SAM-dependent methyltransferase [Dokdonella sp. MW10]|uniref:class I SAM-dependent methyltransferase n=1 Tax=Dokdonella sp. MW10 TaxID=2992926 RepID=UPI003F7F84D0
MHDLPTGYPDAVAYPDTFQRELMPTWLRSTTAALGFGCPDLGAGYHVLELGCGGGLSTLVAAACNPEGRFTGVDVDARQVAHAKARAAALGLDNVDFIAADLRDASLREGTEDVDFIVSHGLWSWVAAEVREAFVAIVRERLAPGGLVALGYMSHPGAAQTQALHRLLRECARHVQGDAVTQVVAGLELLGRLADAGAGFFAEHPGARAQLDAMRRERPEYLVHEFLAEHREPQHVADVMRAFAGAGCAWIGSATPLENIDVVSVPGAVQPLLRQLPPGPLAETTRDLARNQSLRRDLFQKRAERLAPESRMAVLDAITYAALPGAPQGGDLVFDTRIGPVPGPAERFAPVLAALARRPHRFGELRALPAYAERPGVLNQVVQMLVWAGLVHPLRDTPSMRALPPDALEGVNLLDAAGTALVRAAA